MRHQWNRLETRKIGGSTEQSAMMMRKRGGGSGDGGQSLRWASAEVLRTCYKNWPAKLVHDVGCPWHYECSVSGL